MARLLALEWNDIEARVAVASAKGEQAVVEQVFSISLRPDAPDQPATDVGRRIAAALAERGVGRLDAMVSVGRANIELRQLTFPPAPDEELPDMVRFQALREFNALQENWPLDFLPIDEDPQQSRMVLAAAIAPEQVAQIRRTCEAAGLRPRRLVLRGCSAASLFGRFQGDNLPKVRLLVDLLGDEVDLTVMIGRKVVFLRTARLACDPLGDPEAAQILLGEIRRTMAAVQNQLTGRRVEQLVLCGKGMQHLSLAERLSDGLGVPAELFDPFAGLQVPGDVALPEHPGRFAPLLGMLLDELLGTPHAMDFLNPRRRPPPPSRRRMYAATGTVAGVLLLALITFGWLRWTWLGRERERLDEDLKTWTAKAAAVSRQETFAREISNWQQNEIVWLDELRWLSEKAPSAQEVMLTQIELDARNRGGEIKMQGVARSVDGLKNHGQAMRDDRHRVVGKDMGENPANKSYPLQFESSVLIGEEKRK